MVCLSKSRAGKGFKAVSEWGVKVIQSLLSSGGKSDMLKVFWESSLHVGSRMENDQDTTRQGSTLMFFFTRPVGQVGQKSNCPESIFNLPRYKLFYLLAVII